MAHPQTWLTGVGRAPPSTLSAQRYRQALSLHLPESKQEDNSGPCSASTLPQCPSNCSLGELIAGWRCWSYLLSVTICRNLILFCSDNEIAG